MSKTRIAKTLLSAAVALTLAVTASTAAFATEEIENLSTENQTQQQTQQVVAAASETIEVKDEQSLREAVDHPENARKTIKLEGESDTFPISSQIKISQPITLDGNGKTITVNTGRTVAWSNDNSEKYMLLVTANDVHIENVTLNGDYTYKNNKGDDVKAVVPGGIQFYKAKDGTLTDTSVSNFGSLGYNINASTVTASGSIVQDNIGWGKIINVGWGSDIQAKSCSFNASGVTLTGVDKIYSDSGDKSHANGGSISITAPSSGWESFTNKNNGETGYIRSDAKFVSITWGEQKNSYVSLQDAINDIPTDAETATTICVEKEIEPSAKATIKDGRKVIVDLNGKTLTGQINLFKGTLDVKNGTLAGGQALNVFGSSDPSDTNYSVLNVENNVTINANFSICLFPETNDKKLGYGAVVNVNGATLNGIVFVSGNLGNSPDTAAAMHEKANAPTLNVKAGTHINGFYSGEEAQGIAVNGYAVVNLESGSTITGTEAVGIKRGVLNVNGAELHATGDVPEQIEANYNGTEQTGAAISMTGTYNYANPLKVTVNGGTIKSDKGYALFVGHSIKNNQKVPFETGCEISITEGNFVNGVSVDKSVYVEPAVKTGEVVPCNFISGGTFSTDVTSYCVSGKMAKLEDKNYIIVDLPKEVVNKNIATSTTTGINSINVGEKITGQQDQNTAQTVAKSVSIKNTGSTPSTPVTTDEEKIKALSALQQAGLITINPSTGAITSKDDSSQGPVEIKNIREERFDVTTLELKKDTNLQKIDEFVMSIVPVYDLKSTTGGVNEDGSPKDPKKTVTVATGLPREVTETQTINVGLPEGFTDVGESNKLYVTHEKEAGQKYVYEATITTTQGKKEASFVNPNGFSVFSFSVENPTVAKIGDTSYADLQTAVNEAKNGDEIVLTAKAKDPYQSATMSGASRTITVKFAEATENVTVTINNKAYIVTPEGVSVSYTAPSAPTTPSTPNSGVAAGADGKLHVYKDGKVDTGATGLYADAEGKETYYFVKGDLAQDGKYTGLVTDTNGKVASVKDSKVDTTLNGLICIDKGDHRLFENGWTDPTSAYKGLYKNTDGNYYYLEKSAVNFAYNGLVLDEKDNFRLVQDGVCYAASTYKGLAKHVDGWYYYIQDGKLNEQFNGLVTDENGDFRLVQNGVCNTTSPYEGLAKHSDGWFYYLKAGKIDMTYTGLVPDGDLNFWYVYKGCVNTTSTEAYAVQHSDGQWYAIQGGKWDKTFTGTLKDWNGAEHSFTGGTAA